MKWAIWTMKKMATVLLISGLTLAATAWIVNTYVHSLLSSFNIQLKDQPTLWSMVTGGRTTGSSSSAKESLPSAGKEESKANPPSQQTEKSAKMEDAAPVMGTALEEGSEDSSENGASGSTVNPHEALVMTPGEMTERKDNLPGTDKQQILALLMAKLPQEEMQKISAAMEGGLTEKELQDIQQVLARYLSKEEYAKLMQMLKE
ncbi:hypothetical protein Q5741_07130 [Paenibacillus sp. JX-17]|uniref:Magnesium transporter MgtE intracellular domain-containing protein n=1 Tax=Paenibacillus lacisoli TaxID=3064525 RepID=A0ABT9CES1_9BACL|nr:hypothetical protein [Paenibacillus sp. JX-17]MDO7906191.1 hypothetical protein [Paenibacillus sp. JX-17]